MQLTEQVKKEYADLYAKAEIARNWSGYVARAVDTIQKNRVDYAKVESATGVPWHIVAIIHGMEASFDFSTHLHNGDPLSARTVQVPAGRPVSGMPPFTWLESAIDALKYDGAASYKDWSLTGSLYFLEGYNGFGNRSKPGHLSQYLWSGTIVNTPGRYVADGVWDDNAESQQVGCCAMLKEMEARGMLKNSYSAATWFDVQRGGSGVPVITAYAGSIPLAQIASTQKQAIVMFLNEFSGANSVLLSPADKPVPVLNQPAQKNFHAKLLEYCTNKDNYIKVGNEVLQFYPDGTSNGCAAYCSQFLRDVGLAVPIGNNAQGYNTSLVAQSLAEWLIGQGWQKNTIASKVGLGHVIVTKDDLQWPGFAAHIYIICSEIDASGYALCTDNQGLKYRRNITTQGPKTPWAYSLSAP